MTATTLKVVVVVMLLQASWADNSEGPLAANMLGIVQVFCKFTQT
jgi:hypothetical protein